MDMEMPQDETVQWAVDFLAEKISEQGMLLLKQAIVTEQIDGEALMLMQASDMQQALGLAFGPAIKLQKALSTRSELESVGSRWEMVGGAADPLVGALDEHLEAAELHGESGFCKIGRGLSDVLSDIAVLTCSTATVLAKAAKANHGKLHAVAAGHIGMVLAALALGTGFWWWEVVHQRDICGRLGQCTSVADATLSNYSAVGESLLAVADVNHHLSPARWWGSNQFRAKVWAGPGESCFGSIDKVVDDCLHKGLRAQRLCHEGAEEVRCIFSLAAYVQRIVAPVPYGMLSNNRSMETLQEINALGERIQEGLTQSLSFELWSHADLAAIFRWLDHAQLFRAEAQASPFKGDLQDLLSNIAATEQRGESKLDVLKAIDDVVESAKELQKPEPDQGLRNVVAVLDRAFEQKGDPEVSSRYRRWSEHVCSGLTSFAEIAETQAADLTATWMFAMMAGHLQGHLQNCGLEHRLQAAQNRMEQSLRTREGLHKLGKFLDEADSWRAWAMDKVRGRSKNPLKQMIEKYISAEFEKLRLQHLASDRGASFQHLEFLRMAADELQRHIPRELHAKVTKASEDLWRSSLAPLKALSANINAGCAGPLEQHELRTFAEHLRYTWYRSDTQGRKVELETAFATLDHGVLGRLDNFESKMKHHNDTTPVKVKGLKVDLTEIQNCKRALLPLYFLLLEDGDLCGAACAKASQQLRSIMETRLSQSATAAPLLRALTRLGLPAEQACDCSAVRASGQTQGLSPPDPTGNAAVTSDLRDRWAKVEQRDKAARDFLMDECSRPSCKEAEGENRFLFSGKVHDLLLEQPSKFTSALSRGLYDDASAILAGLHEWSSLPVHPPLPTSAMQSSMKDSVKAHAEAASSEAVLLYEKRQFRSLQSRLASIASIRANFGASDSDIKDQLDNTWEALRERILKYAREIHDRCFEIMKERTDGDVELFQVAEGLVDLGLVAFEVESFNKQLSKWISSLLVAASAGGRGVEYLLRLGQLLMKDQEETDGASDGTISRSAAARRVASEFKQFQNVQNMFWNKAVSKMQKDPDECVNEMSLKSLAGNGALELNRTDLKDGLKRFWEHYHTLQNRSLRNEIQLSDLPDMCLQEVTKHRSNSSQEIEVRLVKEHIPELLAYVFLHYSITATGDEYVSHLQKSMTGEDFQSLLGGMKIPHNIQVLAVLRFFGFGYDQPSHDLSHQLVQIETGGGKSLVLGATATLFAVLGFQVRVVCYSDYLSNRDALEFNRTMSDFHVASQVKYSKITTFSEDMVAMKGDLRSLTQDLLQGKPLGQQPSQAPSGSKQVLLVDEVDVFMGADFIGKTHDQVHRVQDPDVRRILESLWQRRDEARTPQSTQRLCGEVTSSSDYRGLRNKFKAFEVVIDMQVRMMCFDLLDYMRREPPMPEFHPQKGCMGYKIQDRIDCDAVFGYKTAFAYLEKQQKLSAAEPQLNEHLSLLVPCGLFSYTNIKPRYIFGVSGTVEQLQAFQRQELQKHGLQSFTTVPSVYGQSKFSFLSQNDAIKIVPKAEFHQAIAICIQEKIKDGRAIIVFFRDGEQLRQFQLSSFAAKLSVPAVLTEKLSFDEKAHLIKKAANAGQVTLSTAAFGRGSDFVSYDEKLQKNGGVHVLQTFVPADSSEEVQFQGRTARQGKKGTYSLILEADDLQQDLGLDTSLLDDGQSKGYQQLRAARDQKQAKMFAAKASEVLEAQKMDDLSHAYFDHLLAERTPQAAKAYTEMATKMLSQQGMSQTASGSHHYVVCLDESGSMMGSMMWGSKFDAARAAVQAFAKQAASLNQGTGSAVSLVMFSSGARVICDKTPLESHAACTSNIPYSGGGTEFGPPLQRSIDLIRGSQGRFQKQFILLYTDGGAGYPGDEVERLIQVRQELAGNLDFFAISEQGGTSLESICRTLYPSSPLQEHCLSQIGPEQISKAFQETLRRINMAYVKPA